MVFEEIVKKDGYHALKRKKILQWDAAIILPSVGGFPVIHFFVGQENAELIYGAQIAHYRVDSWPVHFHTVRVHLKATVL